VSGGAGNDLLTGGPAVPGLGSGNDTLSGGAGNDTLVATDGTTYLRGDDGNDSIQGGSGFNEINGNMGNDTVHGGSSTNWVVGGQGDDSLVGGGGFQDIVLGNLGNDTLSAGTQANVVRGGQGDDVLTGGPGNDYISDDLGKDTESGGGADIFHGSQNVAIDRITDFNYGQGDRVELDPGTTFTASQVGADTVVDLGAGNQMVLVGVQFSTLPADWIFLGTQSHL
jgi:Ca2+-binding RTX toxin-like protein